MVQTTLKRNKVRWTDHGDFSVHIGKGFTLINNRLEALGVANYSNAPSPDQWFNSYQYFLFRRCLYGLDVYSKEEMHYISSQKKKRIIKVHEHSKQVINAFKQKLLVERTNKMLLKLFPCSPDVKAIIAQGNDIDHGFECSIKFENFGITRKDIAQELVESKCLPHNFFNLTLNDDPRLIQLKSSPGNLGQK